MVSMSVKKDLIFVIRSDLVRFLCYVISLSKMNLSLPLREALVSLIDNLMLNPQNMRNMAYDLKPLTKDDTEVAFGIFVGYVTGGFAELFFESQKRCMTSMEAEEMRKIIFERALEMKKAIAYVRSQETKS